MIKVRWMVAGLTALLLVTLSQRVSAQSFRVDSVQIGGDGGTDYLTVDTATGRVFVSRATHVMVLDGNTGQVIGDIPETPRVHGIALVHQANRGFTTNGGDSTVSIFDLKSLALIQKLKVPTGGLDGIMYDASINRVVLTNHSRPRGTTVEIDPDAGTIVATGELEDDSPEGAAGDGKGTIFVNNEGTSTIQVLEASSLAAKASWPLAPCEGPTGIAYDREHKRIFAGCSDTSVVLNAVSGKVVAKIANGAGVDALGWDPTERLIYIPAGRAGALTVAHQDDADHYTVVATVTTFPGAKTVAVNPKTHVAYLFQPEYGPAPAPAPGTPPPAPGSRPPRGPVIGAWFLIVRHGPVPARHGAGIIPPGAGRLEPASIRWYHVSAALAGVAAVSLLDRRVQRSSQNSRSSGRDDVAKVFRHAGNRKSTSRSPGHTSGRTDSQG